MKKLILLVALATLASALIGCGAKEEGDTAAQGTPPTTETKPPADKPTDDKAAATGSTGATGDLGATTGTGTTTGSVPPADKPTDDKAAAGK